MAAKARTAHGPRITDGELRDEVSVGKALQDHRWNIIAAQIQSIDGDGNHCGEAGRFRKTMSLSSPKTVYLEMRSMMESS
jgi:hypothetical protein